jgi:enoyl-CoA hydratase/carnithine racemase
MSLILTERPEPGVLVLTLNRPEARNALSMPLRHAIADALDAAAGDDTVRVAVLAGHEKAFAAGADLKELVDAGPIDLHLRGAAQIWDRIAAFPKPLIAAVEGVALGGGCELALHCDIILAGEDARFGQPEVRLGILPGGSGTQRLVRAVGKYKAMMLVLTGEIIGAREASEMGLVSRVVGRGEAVAQAVAMAATIAAHPPLAVELAKEVTLTGQDASLAAALSLERKAFYLLAASEDKREGMRAFLDKRPPTFKGR